MSAHILTREACPACGHTTFRSFFKRSFNEELLQKYMFESYQGNANMEILKDVDFEIVRCNACSLAYQKYILDDEMLDELYDKWIDPVLAREWTASTGESVAYYEKIFNFTISNLGKRPADIKVLDFGAGFGDSLIIAKRMGFDCYAFEYSLERIRYMEQKDIKVITADSNSDMLFDLIILNEVLEHVSDPCSILKAINSRLKQNGIVYFDVPDCAAIEEKMAVTQTITSEHQFKAVLLAANVCAFQHINFFNNKSLRQLLKKEGLKIMSPFKQAFTTPISIKSFFRPFYRYYIRTGFYLVKS